MTKSLLKSHAFKKLKLFFLVAGLVTALSALKFFVHTMQFEFVTLSTLLTSAIGGAIFIIGFLLSGILSDYKECERLPAEIRVSLEAILDDVNGFADTSTEFSSGPVRTIVDNTLRYLETGLGHPESQNDLQPVIREIDKLSPIFSQLAALGMPANFVVRLRGHQDQLRRCIFRIFHVQTLQFVPSIYILVKTLVAAIVVLLLFLETEGSPGTALIFGFICYMFIYALYLIETLERPFRKDRDTLDDVSLFLLRDLQLKLAGVEPLRPIDQSGGQA